MPAIIVVSTPKGPEKPDKGPILEHLEALKEYLDGIRAACATLWDIAACMDAETEEARTEAQA